MGTDSEVEIFKKSITIDVSSAILRSFLLAKKALLEVLNNSQNSMLTDSHFYSNLRAHLWNYAVSRQLSKITEDAEAPIVSNYLIVNHYNKKVLYLQAEKTVFTFHKTRNDKMLPSGRIANYMKNFADRNGKDNYQLRLTGAQPERYDPPYYGMIIFGLALNDFSHISIVMPDQEVKQIRTYIPIYNGANQFQSDLTYNEKQLTSLRDDIFKEIENRQR